jgi:hypothetical protein
MMRHRLTNNTALARLSGFAAALALLAAGLARAQEAPARAAQEPGPSRLFRPAQAIGEGATPDAFEFELSGYSYRIASNGAGRRVRREAVRRFNLRLEGSDWLRHVQFAEYEGNVLLVCEVSDGETGAGFVVRLEQPSMRALWRAELSAFNVGPPLRDGGHLYLTGIGFAAKLELDGGRFLWRHTRLYGRAGEGSFNSFDLPEIDGDAVVFREATRAGLPAKALRVHRKTGKILGIE